MERPKVGEGKNDQQINWWPAGAGESTRLSPFPKEQSRVRSDLKGRQPWRTSTGIEGQVQRSTLGMTSVSRAKGKSAWGNSWPFQLLTTWYSV